MEQVPRGEHAAEAVPLRNIACVARFSRRQGPQAIGNILVAVLARLGDVGLQSEARPRAHASVSETSI